MAKSASKITLSGIKHTVSQMGYEVDLTDSPLIYGKKDKNITDAQRKSVEAQETKRKNAKIEYAAVYDENGNIIGKESRGSVSSVSVPDAYLTKRNSAMTHNHPRGKGEELLIGGTYSYDDIELFGTTKIRTMRASAKEGTYSISKTRGFDSAGLMSYYKNIVTQSKKEHTARKDSILQDVKNGKLSADSAEKTIAKSFNKHLVNLHNGLLAGQKKYGYNYTLEGK